VDHPGRGPCRAIADRVQAKTRHQPFLVVDRQHLAQQGVIRIAVAHARAKARGTRSGKAAAAALGDARRLRRQAERREQLARVADASRHCLAPVGRARVGGTGRGGPGVRGRYHYGLAAAQAAADLN
jgi:hypothetical protein